MASKYRLTPRAVSDLGDIWDYIANDNFEAANRVEQAIFSACESLGRNPLLGSKRTEITALPVRFWTVPRFPNYMVVYRPDRKPVQVIAILHAKRNIREVLQEQPP